MNTIEFHFDFGSPNAYLVHQVIPAVAAAHGVRFEYVPVLLGGVFKATGNVSPMVAMDGIRNKPAYQQIETRRFCAEHGIAVYTANPHFPVNTLKLMRGAVQARALDIFAAYVDAMYDAMWQQALKMDDDAVIDAALESAGLPVDALRAGMNDPDIKQQLVDLTEASVARGNFGSPTFFVSDEMFFGKDKLRDAVAWATRN